MFYWDHGVFERAPRAHDDRGFVSVLLIAPVPCTQQNHNVHPNPVQMILSNSGFFLRALSRHEGATNSHYGCGGV
jgi:hypothetical protein